ncbi:MAG: hypothetical protein ACK55Z_36000, partial [bacterium]
PALHGVDAPAVAHAAATDRDRGGKRRAFGGREDRVVERDRRRNRTAMGSQVVGGAKAGDAWIHGAVLRGAA